MLEPPPTSPPRASAEATYTSLGWCGSCRFDVLEPPRISAEAPYTITVSKVCRALVRGC